MYDKHVRYLYDRRDKRDTMKKKKKENEFLKESILASGDFSGLCVKMVRKYFITVCKKRKAGQIAKLM